MRHRHLLSVANGVSVGTDGGMVLQSCDPSQNTFVCGIFNDSCSSGSFPLTGANTIILRLDQVEDGSMQQRRINPTSTFTSLPSQEAPSSGFSTVDMVGVGVGIGVPLLVALITMVLIAISQRRRIRQLRAETKVAKEDPGLNGPTYAHSMPLQPPNSACGGFEYQPLTSTRPQGHFQEVVVNELDGSNQPTELGSAKPR